jgi:hypothetical protein
MSFESLAVPTLAVNGYLWDTMKQLDPTLTQTKRYGNKIPFFPIGDSASGQKQWENKPYFIYDRVFRFSSNPFYPKKRESFLYYLKAKPIDTLQWSAAVQLILDREDDAGKDINDWIRNNGGSDEYPLYFHYLRVYQARSGSPSSDDSVREETSRPYYITEFMIDVCYHHTKSLEDYLA